MSWLNLNDSFSALTGHISNLTSTVLSNDGLPLPSSPFGDGQRIRQLETQCFLLKKEVQRMRHLSLVDEESRAEGPTNSAQQPFTLSGDEGKKEEDPSKSQPESEVYEEVDLNPASALNSFDGQQQQERVLPSPPPPHDEQLSGRALQQQEPLFAGLPLDAAAEEINRLEDELRKVSADREHWRHLATQKTGVDSKPENDLGKREAKCQELERTLSLLEKEKDRSLVEKQLENKVQQLEAEKSSLESSLDQLDQQHEAALEKVLELKSHLTESNVLLNAKVEQLSKELNAAVEGKTVLEEEVEKLKAELRSRDLIEDEAVPAASFIATSSLQPAGREEPEGALIPSDEVSTTPPTAHQQATGTNFKLEAVILELKEKAQVLSEDNSRLQSFIQPLEAQLEQRRQELVAFEGQLAAIVSERDKLSNAFHSKCDEVNSIQAEVSHLKNVIQGEHQRMEVLQNENMALVLQKQADDRKELDEDMTREALQSLSRLVRDKDEEIGVLKGSIESLEVELKGKSCDENDFSSQESSNIETVERLQQEKEKLAGELERLRHHLIEIEEGYTQEVLLAEEREKELRDRVAVAESRADSFQAQLTNNEQVEKMEETLRAVTRERDQALSEVSTLDDKVHQYSASVSNLQLVLEQIQKENERKLQLVEKQRRASLEAEQSRTEELRKKLKWQEERFTETSAALGAAGRLTDQLDLKESLILSLKSEISNKETVILRLKEEIEQIKSSHEGKVDKQIMKSLVLGYFNTPPDKKYEVERLLARILDFNREEMTKAGIQIGRDRQGLSLGGRRLSGALPQGGANSQSLSTLFVQFLEHESSRGTHSPNNKPVRELARDLSKAASSQSKEMRTNPFLTPTPVSLKSSASTSPSSTPPPSYSSASSAPFPPHPPTALSADNHLLSQPIIGSSINPIQPLIFSSSETTPSLFQTL